MSRLEVLRRPFDGVPGIGSPARAAESRISSSGNGSQATDGLQGWRLPASAEVVHYPQLGGPAPVIKGSSVPDSVPHNARSAGDGGAVDEEFSDKSDRAGRHRHPGHAMSDRADHEVTGGWVPQGAANRRGTADPEVRSVPAPPARMVPTDDGDNDSRRQDDEPDDDEKPESEDDGQEPGNTEQTPAVRARRVGRHWGRFAELWVPEPLRDARVDPGRRGAIVLLLVATLAAVVTAFGVGRDRPEPRPVDTSGIAALAVSAEPSAGSPPGSLLPVDETPVGSAQAGQPSQAAGDAPVPTPVATEIVVSVTGLVDKPGIVTLTTGARVADAIAAAGGAVEGADLTGLNLAARLADGDSVVVGSTSTTGHAESGVSGVGDNKGAATDSGDPSAAGGLVDLNTADEAALDTLPGVGPVMAQNIIAWRETNGKFNTVEQLQEISGIGPSRYAQIAPLVTVS